MLTRRLENSGPNSFVPPSLASFSNELRPDIYFLYCLIGFFVHILGWHCCYTPALKKIPEREKCSSCFRKMGGLFPPPLWLALSKMCIPATVLKPAARSRKKPTRPKFFTIVRNYWVWVHTGVPLSGRGCSRQKTAAAIGRKLKWNSQFPSNGEVSRSPARGGKYSGIQVTIN